MTENAATHYSEYLMVDPLLTLQQPLSTHPEHDELLFIIVHQTYELWFKQIVHELRAARGLLFAGLTDRAMAVLTRIRTVLKTCVSQVDILETMTPLQFESFRTRLGQASGFQSAQFREIEALLGRRDRSAVAQLRPVDRMRVEHAMAEPTLWDATCHFMVSRGQALPMSILERDVRVPYQPTESVQQAVLTLYRTDQSAALVFERLVDIDVGMQEWRYRHVMMVERTIGSKSGTGGSTGVDYLRTTLFQPIFPELWRVRHQF